MLVLDYSILLSLSLKSSFSPSNSFLFYCIDVMI